MVDGLSLVRLDPDAPAKPLMSQRHGGTQVVYGRKAATNWSTALENAPARLTSEQVDRLWSEINRHLQRRDANESTASPVPATTMMAFWTLTTSVVAFAAAALISLYSYTLTMSWLAWAIASAAEIFVGALARKRWHLPRAVAGSWVTGTLAIVATGVVGLLI